MDAGAEVTGLPELRARVDHASAGVLDLTRQLGSQLQDTTPPMAVFASPTMRARPWGTGDVWTLPAGGWVAARDGSVHLPDDIDALTDHVQQLLDGH